MEYYLKFMFLLMQLLFVQIGDLKLNNFYQNVLMTTKQTRFQPGPLSFRSKDRSLVFYSKSQTTTPITSMHTSYDFDIYSIYESIEQSKKIS